LVLWVEASFNNSLIHVFSDRTKGFVCAPMITQSTLSRSIVILSCKGSIHTYFTASIDDRQFTAESTIDCLLTVTPTHTLSEILYVSPGQQITRELSQNLKDVGDFSIISMRTYVQVTGIKGPKMSPMSMAKIIAVPGEKCGFLDMNPRGTLQGSCALSAQKRGKKGSCISAPSGTKWLVQVLAVYTFFSLPLASFLA
jgi:hypothetical protein